MSQVHSFPPIASPSARILILGTMPGKASLMANRYYAHPRNSFWTILGQILGFESLLPYEERLDILRSSGIAVWDVLQLCTRESSLDSDIDEPSVVPNDFVAFFEAHDRVQRICFNGAKAAKFYAKFVQPQLAGRPSGHEHILLPSTSPANAGVPYHEKLRAWTAALADPAPAPA